MTDGFFKTRMRRRPSPRAIATLAPERIARHDLMMARRVLAEADVGSIRNRDLARLSDSQLDLLWLNSSPSSSDRAGVLYP